MDSWQILDLLPASQTMLPGNIKMAGVEVLKNTMQWNLYLNTGGNKHLKN